MDKLKRVAIGSTIAVFFITSMYLVMAASGMIFITFNVTTTGLENHSNMTGSVKLSTNLTLIETDGAFNVSNVTFSYYNASSAWVNISVNTTANASGYLYSHTWDTSGVPDRVDAYALRAIATTFNGSTVTSRIIYNVTIDNAGPKLVNLTFPVEDTYTTNRIVRFNFTAQDNRGPNVMIKCNVTINGSAYNLHGWENQSASLKNGTSTNLTIVLSDGRYTWNVSCWDDLGNKNYSTGRLLVIDASDPSLHISSPTVTNINLFGQIELKCKARDDTASVNSTKLEIIKPSGETVEIVENDDEVVHTFGGQTSISDTDEMGQYDVKCTVKDRAGNSHTYTKENTFLVTHSVGGGGAGTAGSAPSQVTTVEGTATLGALTAAGSTTTLAKDEKATFTVAGEEHTATIVDVTATKATIRIESPATHEITLDVAESKKLDLDNDGIYDLQVTLNGIIDGEADVTLRTISEEAITEETTEETTEESTTEPAKKASYTWLWILIAVVIIAAIIYVVKKKK